MSDPKEESFDLPEFDDGPGEKKPEAGGESFDLPEFEDAQQASSAPEEPSWEDILLAGSEGASLGHARVGEDIGNWMADLLHPRPKGTELHGGGLIDRIPDTSSTRAAKMAGTLATTVPASIAAGPGIGAQAALGAGLGAASAHGAGESMAGGALAGGALGAFGGVVAKGAASLAGRGMLNGIPSTGTRAGQAASKLAEYIPGKYAAITERALEPALSAVGKASPAIAPMARAAGQAAASRSGVAGDELGSVIGAGKAQAQEKAYAGMPTTTWAVQSVLASDTNGLSPQDRQRLTEAVISGDERKLIAANFELQQRNPAYAKRLQEEYESLNERR